MCCGVHVSSSPWRQHFKGSWTGASHSAHCHAPPPPPPFWYPAGHPTRGRAAARGLLPGRLCAAVCGAPGLPRAPLRLLCAWRDVHQRRHAQGVVVEGCVGFAAGPPVMPACCHPVASLARLSTSRTLPASCFLPCLLPLANLHTHPSSHSNPSASHVQFGMAHKGTSVVLYRNKDIRCASTPPAQRPALYTQPLRQHGPWERDAQATGTAMFVDWHGTEACRARW